VLVNLKQGSPEWLEWRRSGIGSSDIPALLGLAKNRSAFSVWTEKMYGSEGSTDFTATRGKYLEAGVAQWVADELGVELLGSICVQHDTKTWARASLDQTFRRPGQEWAGMTALEIKTDRNYNEWAQGVPARVLCQVDWEMFCADSLDAEVGAYLPVSDEFLHFTIERDAEREAIIVSTAERFWNENVLGETPPDIDDSDACSDWLTDKYQTYQNFSRPATDAEAVTLQALLIARQTKKQVNEAEAELSNRVKAIIGSGEGIVWAGGKAQWKADAKGNRRLTIKGLDTVRGHV
jgi:putative phage-type endonuclease